ncbi:LytR/AlgR family response regulator transcription factor [Chryseolinea lacunae]|uniref:Response regulator transcription factor n=1 Tax=Chryseolinea lacunae TaxID=2801331 RepID=A0ABS1KQ53_9BACT|nr:LytTR family DNA-binding domain-containing protein [Chryseolinea lacunae]MBL0741377.1 response regulator transcription factor [Chryseolinea lacunae]
MSTIRCLIIDDEPLAQNVLETFIQRINFLTLVGKCDNAIDAFDKVNAASVDLIFCDIQMPQITGIEFVKALKETPYVIFTTAYPEYALEGFNVDAIDYLIKPIPFERFLKSVNKVKMQQKQGTADAHEGQTSQTNHIFVKQDYKLVKINYDDIISIEGMKDYVKVHTSQKVIITHITMKRLEELLPNTLFFRSHKSYIVRLNAIKAINGNVIELINNFQAPIGLQYRDALLNQLKNI